jgi:hypothetical protein
VDGRTVIQPSLHDGAKRRPYAPPSCLSAIDSNFEIVDLETALNHGWASQRNIENNPMQSRNFAASRAVLTGPAGKNILIRRANHLHIFIVARIQPAPENPPRAF